MKRFFLIIRLSCVLFVIFLIGCRRYDSKEFADSEWVSEDGARLILYEDSLCRGINFKWENISPFFYEMSPYKDSDSFENFSGKWFIEYPESPVWHGNTHYLVIEFLRCTYRFKIVDENTMISYLYDPDDIYNVFVFKRSHSKIKPDVIPMDDKE